jgi:peptidyl-prolyl cis-trans isomerase C
MFRFQTKAEVGPRLHRAAMAALLVCALAGCSKGGGGGQAGSVTTAKLPAEQAATVDGAPIATKDVNQMIQVLVQQGWQPDSTTQGATIDAQRRNFAVDRLIERQLVLNEAKRKNMVPTPAEIDQRLAQVKAAYGIRDSFPAGMDEPTLRKNLADDLTITQYFNKAVIDSMPVPDTEVAAYYNSHPEMFSGKDRIHARHILFMVDPQATPDARAAVRKKAQAVLDMAKKGEDFSELARKHSEDPGSAPNGGDLQWFNRGQMVPEFDSAAFSLEPGQISDLVETSFGIHIIKVEEKGKPIALEEVRSDLERMLRGQRAQTAVKTHIDTLKSKAKIVKSDTMA